MESFDTYMCMRKAVQILLTTMVLRYGHISEKKKRSIVNSDIYKAQFKQKPLSNQLSIGQLIFCSNTKF